MKIFKFEDKSEIEKLGIYTENRLIEKFIYRN